MYCGAKLHLKEKVTQNACKRLDRTISQKVLLFGGQKKYFVAKMNMLKLVWAQVFSKRHKAAPYDDFDNMPKAYNFYVINFV